VNRKIARRATLAALAAVVSAFAWGQAAVPANAADGPPGWLRLTPNAATIDDSVDVLSQGPCPSGTNIQVAVTGPGIPKSNQLGYIVGNTFITALPSLPSNQLYVPLQLTFRSWFGRNVPGLTPSGVYTLTLTCRQALKPAALGTFVAQVRIAKSGKFVALGEAAKPLNAKPPTDSDYTPPTASAPSSPTPTSSAGGQPAPTSGSSNAAPSTVPSVSDPNSAAPQSGAGSQVAASESAGGQPGSGLFGKLALLLGALILGAMAVTSWRARRRPSE
jgi:hypothetical protein